MKALLKKQNLLNGLTLLIVLLLGYVGSKAVLEHIRGSSTEGIFIIGDYAKYGVSGESRVVIYTWDDCTACRDTKEYMKKKGVGFIEKEVTKNSIYRSEWKELNSENLVPIVLVGNKQLVGYSYEGLTELISDL